MGKVELIAADLRALGAPAVPGEFSASIAQALLTAQALRLRAAEDADSLLGPLYVFEGATRGGAVIQRHVDLALDLDGRALSYLGSYGPERGDHFLQFCARLNAVGRDPDLQRRAAAAASECFEHVAQLLHALERDAVGDTRMPPAFHINPQAGSHLVTLDPVEIDAGLRAGERTLRKFPYVLQRFGERGLRFTRSDSAWLAQLARSPEQRVHQQVAWLARVLAVRGMPQLILESHLGALSAALTVARPARAARYRKLALAAAALMHQRGRHLSDAQLDELGRALVARAPVLPWIDASVGKLLGAAVADEAAGVSGAVASLVEWLGDRQRFPEAFVRAVHRTLDDARAMAAGATRRPPGR